MGLLRVLLALSVVVTHYGGFFGYAFAGAFAAVQMFYVISGFYMATILTEKYDPYTDLGVFYSNRFLRIYSVYFVCLLLSLAAYVVIYYGGHGRWLQYVIDNVGNIDWQGKLWLAFTTIFIFGQESTLFLELSDGALRFTPDGPGDSNHPVWLTMPVPQAWSISLELMFYCIVPFLIRNRTWTLLGIVAATLVLRIAIYGAGYERDPWMSRFFPLELGLFVLGMVARRVYDAYIEKIGHNTQIFIAISFLILTCLVRELMFLAGDFHLSISYVIWPYYFSALIALPCLFHVTRGSKIDNRIGSFSYPVYLLHWIVMIFYDAFAAQFHWPGTDSWIRVAILVAGSFVIAWIIVVSIEIPIDRYRHRRFAATA